MEALENKMSTEENITKENITKQAEEQNRESKNKEKQNGESQNKKGYGSWKHSWIIVGICVSLLAAAIFSSFYGIWDRTARETINNPLESEEHLTYLYKNCYVLYRDLYNRQNQGNENYAGVYLEAEEGYEWLIDQEVIQMAEESEEEEFNSRLSEKSISVPENTDDSSFFYEYMELIRYIENYFSEMEANFGELNTTYDYVIEDTVTGERITNLTTPDISLDEQFLCLTFIFDENGNVSLDNTIKGNDVTRLRKSANAAIRDGSLKGLLDEIEWAGSMSDYLRMSMPKNCRVTFCISNLDWSKMEYNGIYAYAIDNGHSYPVSYDRYDAYLQTPFLNVFLLLTLLVCLAGLFWPAFKETKPWNQVKLCRHMPIEGLVFIAYLLMVSGSLAVRLAMWVNGVSVDSFVVFMPRQAAYLIVYGLNILALMVFYVAAWYVGICLRALREQRLKEYIRERSLIYRIFPYARKKFREFSAELEHFDVTKNAKKIIYKVVITNGIILFIIGCFPLGGLAVALIYSVILYFILKKYISNLQKKYGLLLKVTNEIAEGNLNTEIREDLGVFEPFKPQIIRIQRGFKKAVDEEIKSQKMKSELITNVSHDLKTPLTAIITYINLLKEEHITPEQRKEYLNTLERKSLRLKVLIEDLFEVSKANSQNLTLDIVDVDIVNLLKQVAFEMSDKLKETNLDVRMDLPAEKIVLPLDSQKTYRIFENLFGNVAKYALPGTRVYIQCINTDKEISITIKNITAQEIQVSAEELTERFVRGDVSRNTEGSGLGLAIAKSFTELQGGTFKLDVDGDLFKVTVSFAN